MSARRPTSNDSIDNNSPKNDAPTKNQAHKRSMTRYQGAGAERAQKKKLRQSKKACNSKIADTVIVLDAIIRTPKWLR